MPLTTLIVDDEPLARDGLRVLLSRDPEVSAIREARDGLEAVAEIRECNPDLVFLDLQMPEMDGFEVVREIGAGHMPPVVFVTAHDQYAIQAFEINALDYLLKPVIEERFVRALVRAKSHIRSNVAADSNRVFARVINYPVRTEGSDHIDISGAAHSGYIRAERLGDLHSEGAYSPRGAINQHFLPRLNFPFVAKTLQRGERRNWCRGCLLESHIWPVS
jgi:YesN/AraC family two-component response regulator